MRRIYSFVNKPINMNNFPIHTKFRRYFANNKQFGKFDKKLIPQYMSNIKSVRDMYVAVVDWFAKEALSYGHCTLGEDDDAAFLILRALKLPITDISHFEMQNLSQQEKVDILTLVDKRITIRKPVAYLLNEAVQHGETFYVNEHVLIPRSFIGDIICMQAQSVLGKHFSLLNEEKPERSRLPPLRRVLDMCTGSGCLGILMALRFPAVTRVDLCDISQEAIEVANRNIASKNLNERVRAYCGDLFAALPHGCHPGTSSALATNSNSSIDKLQEEADDCHTGCIKHINGSPDSIIDNATVAPPTYDLIICNPPYVTTRVMKKLPAEYCQEPSLALAAGPDGMDVIKKIIPVVGKYLSEDGVLLLEIGDGLKAFRKLFPLLESQAEKLCCQGMDKPGEVLLISAKHLRSV